MSQVKRSMEAHGELLRAINDHIEHELDNDKGSAQRLLEQIEMSMDDHFLGVSRNYVKQGGLYD